MNIYSVTSTGVEGGVAYFADRTAAQVECERLRAKRYRFTFARVEAHVAGMDKTQLLCAALNLGRRLTFPHLLGYMEVLEEHDPEPQP